MDRSSPSSFGHSSSNRVPAAFKAWIDGIVRKGLTLGFDGSGIAASNAKSVDMGEIGRDAFLDRFEDELRTRTA